MPGCSIAFIRMRSPKQRAPGLAPGRVDRDDRDPEPVLLVEPEAADDLVGERALARAAGAGDAERGGLRLRRGGQEDIARLRRHGTSLEARDHPGKRAHPGKMAPGNQCRRVGRNLLREIDVARGDDFVDHSLQPELLPVLRRKDSRDAVVVQLADLVRNDDAAAAAEHLDVRCAALTQAGRACT